MNQLFSCPASPSSQSNDGQHALRLATPVQALTQSSRWTALPSSSIALRPVPSPLSTKDAENQLQAKREAAENTANGVRIAINYTTEPKKHFPWPVHNMRLKGWKAGMRLRYWDSADEFCSQNFVSLMPSSPQVKYVSFPHFRVVLK